MVDRLRQRAGLPMPQVAITPDEQPNAFATGRSPSHAVVAVTQGILKYMPADELEGVLAHELAHVKNRDMLISTVAAVIAGALSNLPYMLMFGGGRDDDDTHPMARIALMLLAPIGAMILQFAISRQREFEADRVGAEIMGRPMPLANALRRLDRLAHEIPMNIAPGGGHAGDRESARRLRRRDVVAVQHPSAHGGPRRAARGDGPVAGVTTHSPVVWIGFTALVVGTPGH